MSKITLNNVGNLQDTTTAETTLNSNNTVVQTAMDNTLSRDGTSPNTMNANIDMNSHQLINLPAPTVNSSPIRLQELLTLNSGGTVIIPTNLTGPITSVGAATSVASQTGSGSKFVMDTSPTLVTPNIGAATGTSLVAGGTDLIPSFTNKVSVANTSGNSGIVVGQGGNHAELLWNYNATPASASFQIDTVSYANPITIDGSAVSINQASGGTTTIYNGAVAPSGTGAYVRGTSPTLTTPAISSPTLTGTIAGNVSTNGNVAFTVAGNGIVGTNTNNNANAGNVGEYVSSSIAAGSPTSLTTNTPMNLTSISLTAGDWDVYFEAFFTFAATTSYTQLISSISTTGATADTNGERYASQVSAANVPGASNMSVRCGPARFSLATTTTIFGVLSQLFTVSTLSAWGTLRARRIR